MRLCITPDAGRPLNAIGSTRRHVFHFGVLHGCAIRGCQNEVTVVDFGRPGNGLARGIRQESYPTVIGTNGIAFLPRHADITDGRGQAIVVGNVFQYGRQLFLFLVSGLVLLQVIVLGSKVRVEGLETGSVTGLINPTM